MNTQTIKKSKYQLGNFRQPTYMRYMNGGLPKYRVKRKFQVGGSVYNDNTVQAAGQGNIQSTASTVFQESNPELQAQRLKHLDDVTKQAIEDAALTASDVDRIQEEGEAKAEYEGEKAFLESKGKSEALMDTAGSALTLAKKSGAFAPTAPAGTQLITNTATGAQQSLAPGATIPAGYTASSGVVGGAGVGTGVGKFATSGVGLGTIASLAGAGISHWADDDDPTHSTFGEYSGAVLSGAGAGATYGSYFGPAGTLIGGVAGGIYGGLSQMWGTDEAKEAEEKAKKEFEEKKRKAIKKYNASFVKSYGTQLSAAASGRIASKTYSGYDLGRNVVAQLGGMRMGMPRYGQAA